MQVSAVFERVRDILSDPDGATWSNTSLLRWANDGVRTIVDYRPRAVAVPTVLALTAGARQQLPGPVAYLLNPLCMTSGDGSIDYDAVTSVSLEDLDREAPGWRSDPEQPNAIHMATDPNDAETFWVYPPVDGTRALRALAASYPAEMAADTDAVPFRNDRYIPALTDYICFRALLQDSDEPAERQRAVDHGQNFSAAIGVHSSMDQMLQAVRDR